MTESDMTSSKLVFIDIDGTLADENHIVPESAKTACARAQANGHKLFICTGRSAPKIERNILDLGFDGVVSVAGAQANIGDKLLFQHLAYEMQTLTSEHDEAGEVVLHEYTLSLIHI